MKYLVHIVLCLIIFMGPALAAQKSGTNSKSRPLKTRVQKQPVGGLSLPLPSMELPPAADVDVSGDEAEEKYDSVAKVLADKSNTPKEIASAWCSLAGVKSRNPYSREAQVACNEWKSYYMAWTKALSSLERDYSSVAKYVGYDRTKKLKARKINLFLEYYGSAARYWPEQFSWAIRECERAKVGLNAGRGVIMQPDKRSVLAWEEMRRNEAVEARRRQEQEERDKREAAVRDMERQRQQAAKKAEEDAAAQKRAERDEKYLTMVTVIDGGLYYGGKSGNSPYRFALSKVGMGYKKVHLGFSVTAYEIDKNPDFKISVDQYQCTSSWTPPGSSSSQCLAFSFDKTSSSSRYYSFLPVTLYSGFNVAGKRNLEFFFTYDPLAGVSIDGYPDSKKLSIVWESGLRVERFRYGVSFSLNEYFSVEYTAYKVRVPPMHLQGSVDDYYYSTRGVDKAVSYFGLKLRFANPYIW
ncbi:MAG: hypothetical protein KKH28_05850 [Elusimicrobia bacterium]|nr:hypothetical protein [Elusimicrobiota bacterium]